MELQELMCYIKIGGSFQRVAFTITLALASLCMLKAMHS